VGGCWGGGVWGWLWRGGRLFRLCGVGLGGGGGGGGGMSEKPMGQKIAASWESWEEAMWRGAGAKLPYLGEGELDNMGFRVERHLEKELPKKRGKGLEFHAVLGVRSGVKHEGPNRNQT